MYPPVNEPNWSVMAWGNMIQKGIATNNYWPVCAFKLENLGLVEAGLRCTTEIAGAPNLNFSYCECSIGSMGQISS
jgi:hypothetical protein